MRNWCLAAALALAGCGKEEAPRAKAPAPPAPPTAPKPPEVKSDPAGKNLCLACQIRTNESACPKCKAVLKAPVADMPKAAPSGDAGKSAVGAIWVCPKPGCKYWEAKKNTCLTHGDTQLKERWYVCAACKVEQPAEGKCSKCASDLKPELR